MTFLDILFVELSKFSSGISDFFPLPYTQLFWNRNFKSEIFSILPNRFFDHTDFTFKSFFKGASAGFSFALTPFIICGVFKRLNCSRLFFSTIFRIDDRMIPVYSTILLDTKSILGRSTCKLTNPSSKSMFSSVETVLGRSEPCLISIESVSLNFFNRRLTEE